MAGTYDEDTAQKRWRTAQDVVRYRRSAQSQLIAQCIAIANRYNADIAVPVLGNDPDSAKPNLSPALINEAIDAPAIRAASTNPMILCPWLTDSTLSRDRADRRRKILASTYWRSNFHLLRRRFFRHLAGYAMGSVCVVPEDSYRDDMPLAKIVLRNPLMTYADPQSPECLDLVTDVGYVHQQSASWIRARYPRSRQEFNGSIPPLGDGDPTGEMYDLLEWVDGDYVLIGIMGKTLTRETTAVPLRESSGDQQLLTWYPNRIGLTPAIAPSVITLDKVISRLTHMIGKADLLSYLWELDIAQTQKAMAPDRYVIAADGETPEIVSNDGRWADGLTGQVNLLSGVKAVGELSGKPDPNNMARLSALERNARQETGLIGAMTGETSGYSGQLRTGRGIDSLMSASVDPAIAELQEIGATALTVLNEAIFATYTGYFGAKKFVVFSGWSGDRKMCEFTPNADIETRANQIYYPLPGTDAYAQTVQLAQMVQAEFLSRDSARRMHPWIDDAESEKQGLAEERIDMLTWQALAQRAAQGGLAPIDAAELIKQIKEGKSIEVAIVAADDVARERQSSTEQPAEPGSPEAMPGLSPPGVEGAEAGGPQPQAELTPQALLAALGQKGAPPLSAAQGGGSPMPVPAGAAV